MSYTKGYPVPVKKFFRELETNAERAYPDNNAMSEIMLKCAQSSAKERLKKSMEARRGAIKRYNWDDTAKQWEDYIDSYTPTDKQSRWDSPPVLPSIPENKPDTFSNNNEFVEWIFAEVMKEPEKARKEEGVRLVRDLNLGAQISLGSLQPLNQQNVFDMYKGRAMNKLQVERVRCGDLPIVNSSYVSEAHRKKKQND